MKNYIEIEDIKSKFSISKLDQSERPLISNSQFENLKNFLSSSENDVKKAMKANSLASLEKEARDRILPFQMQQIAFYESLDNIINLHDPVERKRIFKEKFPRFQDRMLRDEKVSDVLLQATLVQVYQKFLDDPSVTKESRSILETDYQKVQKELKQALSKVRKDKTLKTDQGLKKELDQLELDNNTRSSSIQGAIKLQEQELSINKLTLETKPRLQDIQTQVTSYLGALKREEANDSEVAKGLIGKLPDLATKLETLGLQAEAQKVKKLHKEHPVIVRLEREEVLKLKETLSSEDLEQEKEHVEIYKRGILQNVKNFYQATGDLKTGSDFSAAVEDLQVVTVARGYKTVDAMYQAATMLTVPDEVSEDLKNALCKTVENSRNIILLRQIKKMYKKETHQEPDPNDPKLSKDRRFFDDKKAEFDKQPDAEKLAWIDDQLNTLYFRNSKFLHIFETNSRPPMKPIDSSMISAALERVKARERESDPQKTTAISPEDILKAQEVILEKKRVKIDQYKSDILTFMEARRPQDLQLLLMDTLIDGGYQEVNLISQAVEMLAVPDEVSEDKKGALRQILENTKKISVLHEIKKEYQGKGNQEPDSKDPQMSEDRRFFDDQKAEFYKQPDEEKLNWIGDQINGLSFENLQIFSFVEMVSKDLKDLSHSEVLDSSRSVQSQRDQLESSFEAPKELETDKSMPMQSFVESDDKNHEVFQNTKTKIQGYLDKIKQGHQVKEEYQEIKEVVREISCPLEQKPAEYNIPNDYLGCPTLDGSQMVLQAGSEFIITRQSVIDKGARYETVGDPEMAIFSSYKTDQRGNTKCTNIILPDVDGMTLELYDKNNKKIWIANGQEDLEQYLSDNPDLQCNIKARTNGYTAEVCSAEDFMKCVKESEEHKKAQLSEQELTSHSPLHEITFISKEQKTDSKILSREEEVKLEARKIGDKVQNALKQDGDLPPKNAVHSDLAEIQREILESLEDNPALQDATKRALLDISKKQGRVIKIANEEFAYTPESLQRMKSVLSHPHDSTRVEAKWKISPQGHYK